MFSLHFAEECNSTSFRCSPVQCIPHSMICDDKIDCNNRRDEYCGKETWYSTDGVCFFFQLQPRCLSLLSLSCPWFFRFCRVYMYNFHFCFSFHAVLFFKFSHPSPNPLYFFIFLKMLCSQV